MCTNVLTLPSIQKLTLIIYSIGLIVIAAGAFRAFYSGQRKLHFLWFIPLLFQFLGMGLQTVCPKASVTASVWKLAFVCSVMCILFSGWLFVHVRGSDKQTRYTKIILPGVSLQVALLVSSLVYGILGA